MALKAVDRGITDTTYADFADRADFPEHAPTESVYSARSAHAVSVIRGTLDFGVISKPSGSGGTERIAG
jgi:hypothetical protein